MALDKQFQKQPWYDQLPSVDLDVSEPNLNQFFEYMYERQEIWHKRFILKQPAPWTTYPILRDYKFTNVYRELDRSSQFTIKHVLLNTTLTRRDLIWQIILYRYFNSPETFATTPMPTFKQYSEAKLTKHINNLKESGINPFTTAYLNASSLLIGRKRIDVYCDTIIPVMHEMVDSIIEAIEESEAKDNVYILITALLKLPNIGNFLAHEIYQDFCYTERYSHIRLMKWDANDFTNVGPGCSTGIRIIFPSCANIKEQEEKLYLLRDISGDYLKQFGEFKYLNWNKKKQEYFVTPGKGQIHLHLSEMWACEFQKLWKMQINQGKQRSKFKAITTI